MTSASQSPQPATLRSAFKTPKASQYLQQLCKHFAHRVPAEWDETQGKVELPGGTASFQADATALQIVISGPDATKLTETQAIVEDHLLRFAHREAPEALRWI